MSVRAERESCVSSGQCVLSAPEVFDQSEADGLVRSRPGTGSRAPGTRRCCAPAG